MHTMSELFFHDAESKIIRLRMQPNFPHEDLNDDNVAMLKYILRQEEGLDAHVEQLQHSQRQIHLIANRALHFLGIATRYAEEELWSFSHGFASFEIINDLVHQPRAYNTSTATQRIDQLFVDTRSFFEHQIEETQRANTASFAPTRDRPAPELELALEHNALANELPNAYDLVIDLGATRGETMAQLQVRTMGAQLARSFQAPNLDDLR